MRQNNRWIRHESTLIGPITLLEENVIDLSLDKLDVKRSTASQNRFFLARECILIRRAIHSAFGAFGNASANWRLRAVSKTRVTEPRKQVIIAVGPALRETDNFAIKFQTIVLQFTKIYRESDI